MVEVFGENVAPTAAIRAILNSYPFSIGLLREILQNSDDARATKQVFVLDRRSHDTSFIYHPYLAATQGSALLAYNNELIHHDDWKALQNIHRSSKTADTSKIGKYGIGFRSCYHVTDTPHILSGSHLAILDPKHDFAEFNHVKVGGVKLNIEDDWKMFRDHIAAFDAFLPSSDWGKSFHGSIFRLPLRTSGSPISNKAVSPDEISQLLKDFAKDELNVSLLFLRNITSIEIYEVDTAGKKKEIARASIDRGQVESYGKYEIRKATIRTHCLDGFSEEEEWRIVHAPFSDAKAVGTLSERLGGDPAATLSQHKLSPVMDFAIPLTSDTTKIGRLFTYLPLPLRTEFPVHINALFSLTQSRQNLRNGGEIGIVRNSDDHALTEWNRLLFESYIPQAWGALLDVLVKCDRIENVFDAWPSLQAEVQSGDYVYWKNMPFHVAQQALKLSVWPLVGTGQPSYHHIKSLLVADGRLKNDVLIALIRAGPLVTQPPQYITDIIRGDVRILSPEIAHEELLNFIAKVGELNDADAQAILSYLLSTANCHYATGLPLLPSIAGPRIALSLKNKSRKSYVLFDETEERLFGAYDSEAVPLRRLPQAVRSVLVSQGPKILNLTKLDGSRVATYLNASPYASPSQEVATDDQMRWLNQFWDWVQKWSSSSTFCNRYYLVPTTGGFKRPSDVVFDPQGNSIIADILKMLDVSVIDPRLNKAASKVLEHLHPSYDIHALLRALPSTIHAQFSQDQARNLCAHLLRYLPSSCSRYGAIATNKYLRSQLRSLPIYPTISYVPDGPFLIERTSVTADTIVWGVNPTVVPIFPQVDSITFLDLRSIPEKVLEYLDARHNSPLSINEMYGLMLQHFRVQSFDAQIAFVKHLDSNFSSVSRGVLNNLATTKFVPAGDGTLQTPKDLVDPQAPLASLFPGASSSLPDTTTPTLRMLTLHLRQLNLFVTKLSMDILRNRIHFIASGDCLEPETLACDLINLVTDTGFDCRNLFQQQHLSLELEWIPTLDGPKSPRQCRDLSSHLGKKYLFDEVYSLVTPNARIGEYLRQAFGWDGDVDFETISQQLTKVLDNPKPSHDKVREIVKELGHRSLTRDETDSLREVLHDRKWVPARGGTLVSIPFALLGGEDLPEMGFHLVVFDQHRHPRVWAFLQGMGCVERPLTATILEYLRELHAISHEKIGERRVTQGLIRLLTWLPPLQPEERTNLFIPDTNGALCSFNDIYYNDVGPSACLYDIGSNTLAHPDISPGLATDLGLQPLGLMGLQGRSDDDLDMGEDLIATIRNRLREYTDSQLLLEFFANASDARATEFNVLIDESRAPTTTLLSPRCRAFQTVPALVIHNNSVFTNEDFKGILRTGVGGKSGRKDTIGQFGLGALTMFHITEFATVVSRDQVLFLNPSKCHLPVDRAALRLPLSTVRKLYKDHLSPLIGLFGFDPPEDINEDYAYAGTIFRLPTRSSKQFFNIEPIFDKTSGLEDVVHNFKLLSSKCLLFTPMTAIRLFQRQYRNLQLLWSVTASRDQPHQIRGCVDVSTVIISSSELPQDEQISSSELPQDEQWRVLSLAVDDVNLPPFISPLQEKYRLRLPPVVRLAASASPKSSHTLFSTLPLPISLDLPVHISGSFILASDRRSIRLDEYENMEALYNRWLLTEVIPRLYLTLLEDRASFCDNAMYWPANTKVIPADTYNTLSTMVIDVVYQMAAMSDYALLRSKFHPLPLLPRDAHLMLHLPRPVVKVLEMIKPLDLVQLPSSVTRRLQMVAGGHVSLVAQKYVHRQIFEAPARFSAAALKFPQLQELIDFLAKDSDAFGCLVGLQLLPLEDGTFTEFGGPSSSCFYVAPLQVIEYAVFKPHRLVHRDLVTTKLLEIGDGINVQRIKTANIGTLLNDYVDVAPILETADPILQLRIRNFWRVFSLLDIPTSTITHYPLIPTLQSGHYLSLTYCKTPSIILANFSNQEWLSQCLSQMGFTLVDVASLSSEVKAALITPELSVGNVLALLFNRQESVMALFDSLDGKCRLKFTSWVRSHFVGKKKGFFLKHGQYSTLPMWRTADGSFNSADQLRMLPRGVTIESVAPFTSAVIASHDLILDSMGIQPSPLRSILNIPTHLEPRLDGAYQNLVRVLLAQSPKSSSIPVPNSQRVMWESNALYSSTDDLFLAAFGSMSEYFIFPSFHNFESQLEQFGLKRQRNLDLPMFKNCIEVFRHQSGDDLRDRAAILFQIFCEELPLRDSTSQVHQWMLLDNLRFIPRNMTPRPLGNDDDSQYIAPHILALPEVVSPSELVHEEFQAIAWSQRALYNAQPHRRILMVHSTLSLPTAEEVVDHLVVLASRVALNHPKDPIVLNHLERTYKWLNDHAQEAQRFLRQKDAISLFLNVDDPANSTEEWNWKRAKHILLDNYDTKHLQCPRDFLKNFHSLLVAAGAVTIDHGPDVELRYEQSTTEESLTGLSESFDQMRRSRICTDVSFVCSPDDEPLYAHRGYLAAYSTHFRGMFSGSFREAGDASRMNPILVHVPGFSRRCVEYVLDYAYTTKVPNLKRDDADIELVLEMLTLAHSWLMSGAQRALVRLMIKMKMVDPFNLDSVRATAQHTQSTDLVRHCSAYEMRNADLVQQAREEGMAAHN